MIQGLSSMLKRREEVKNVPHEFGSIVYLPALPPEATYLRKKRESEREADEARRTLLVFQSLTNRRCKWKFSPNQLIAGQGNKRNSRGR